MKEFIALEQDARCFRQKADELKKVLGITATEMKELF